MEQWIIPVAVQLPLATLVVFLTLKFLEYMQEIQKTNNNTIEKMHQETLAFTSQQAETNREFLRMQREQMNLSTARLAEEIKRNNVEASKEHALLMSTLEKISDKLS